MGANDAAEMLEVAKAECARLERENVALLAEVERLRQTHTPSDEELLEAYRLAVDAEMHAENEETGFGSNMSRRSRLAGLRAVAALTPNQTGLQEQLTEAERLAEVRLSRLLDLETIFVNLRRVAEQYDEFWIDGPEDGWRFHRDVVAALTPSQTENTGAAEKLRPFAEFQQSGLLWLINRQVFHPRGFAIGWDMNPETGEAFGWLLLGDGSEPWSMGGDEAENLAKVNALLAVSSVAETENTK